MRWREGVRDGARAELDRAQELTVAVGDPAVRALAYPDLVGSPLVA